MGDAVQEPERRWREWPMLNIAVFGTEEEAQRTLLHTTRTLEGVCPNGCDVLMRQSRDTVECLKCGCVLVGEKYRAEGDRF